ncbi:MAG: LacI family DNA-binding transcriptional regulator, partial [Bowdeniella nasicola]|nr:LacI family DNA-binding transcriptional regulator [Bowdeniella nasicola]
MSESGHHIPTLSDVAHAAGVSKTTASRVLNGSPRVADATRARVLTAIDELGFTASSSARSLALGKSHAVGIVATEPLDDLLIDPTYGMLLRGISERASALDHVTMLFQAARTAEVAMVMRAVSRGIIDGLIHISPHHDAGLLDRLAASAIPVSLCGKPPSTQAPPRFSAVYSDDVIGARRAALHLVSRGVRRPAIILGPMSDSASADRLIGYREALGELFDAQLVRTGGWGAAAGRQAATALLTSEPTIDAILCASDR